MFQGSSLRVWWQKVTSGVTSWTLKGHCLLLSHCVQRHSCCAHLTRCMASRVGVHLPGLVPEVTSALICCYFVWSGGVFHYSDLILIKQLWVFNHIFIFKWSAFFYSSFLTYNVSHPKSCKIKLVVGFHVTIFVFFNNNQVIFSTK